MFDLTGKLVLALGERDGLPRPGTGRFARRAPEHRTNAKKADLGGQPLCQCHLHPR